MSRERVCSLSAAGFAVLAVFGLNCRGALAQGPAPGQTSSAAPASSDVRGRENSTTLLLYGARQDPQQTPTPQQGPTRTPLTAGGKMRRSFRRAFLSPEIYIRSGVGAAIIEAGERDQPQKSTDDRLADGASRFAINYGRAVTRTIFGSGVFPVLFKQDPRYERSESKKFGRRALHAVSRVFVTRGDDGSLQPNYSRWAGGLTASAVSNLWERSTPGHDRIGADATFRRFYGYFINDAWQIVVFNEFGPDIFKVFKR